MTFGFFAIPAGIAIIVAAIGLIMLVVNTPEYFGLHLTDVWTGLWLFVGITIVAITIIARAIS